MPNKIKISVLDRILLPRVLNPMSGIYVDKNTKKIISHRMTASDFDTFNGNILGIPKYDHVQYIIKIESSYGVTTQHPVMERDLNDPYKFTLYFGMVGYVSCRFNFERHKLDTEVVNRPEQGDYGWKIVAKMGNYILCHTPRYGWELRDSITNALCPLPPDIDDNWHCWDIMGDIVGGNGDGSSGSSGSNKTIPTYASLVSAILIARYTNKVGAYRYFFYNASTGQLLQELSYQPAEMRCNWDVISVCGYRDLDEHYRLPTLEKIDHIDAYRNYNLHAVNGFYYRNGYDYGEPLLEFYRYSDKSTTRITDFIQDDLDGGLDVNFRNNAKTKPYSAEFFKNSNIPYEAEIELG